MNRQARRVLVAGMPMALAASSVRAEEFVGPFPSWLNLGTDFKAVGDGKADDTAAFQKALDTLRDERRTRCVLYVPAGTYRITATLNVLREKHAESQGISLLGEDPATTVLRWDGPAGAFRVHPPPCRCGAGPIGPPGSPA